LATVLKVTELLTHCLYSVSDLLLQRCCPVLFGQEPRQIAETVWRNTAICTWQGSTSYVRHTEWIEVPEGVH